MARRKQIKSVTPIQAHRAENFRLMLLEHHNMTGQDKKVFENFVNNMTAVQLTNLSRQYHTVLEVWYDSDGVSSAIAQDIMKRVMHLAKRTVNQMQKAIFNGTQGAGNINRRIGKLAREQNLKEITQEEILGYVKREPKRRKR